MAVQRHSKASAIIWHIFVETQFAKDKLNHLQRIAVLTLCGAKRTTPQKALEALLYLPSLEHYLKSEAMASAMRLRLYDNDMKLSLGHGKILETIFSHDKILMARMDRINPMTSFGKPFDVVIPSRTDWLDSSELLPSDDQESGLQMERSKNGRVAMVFITRIEILK